MVSRAFPVPKLLSLAYEVAVDPPRIRCGFVNDAELHQEGANLIRRAFEAARDSEVADWRSMTSAVLKNRILDITDREFDEGRWGAEDFRGFVGQFEEIVEVDPSKRPPRVIYLPETIDAEVQSPDAGEGTAITRVASGRSKRIRQDLWRAIVDYSSGQIYVWDDEMAVPKGGDADTRPVLPTLDQAEVRRWRGDFLEGTTLPEDADLGPYLAAWAKSEGGTPGLPGPLRQQWIESFKNRVAQRLLDWFSENSIVPPSDLVEDARAKRGAPTNVEALRSYVMDCVRMMNRAELEDLRLPPSAALRAARRR